jgi:hypothetical protein
MSGLDKVRKAKLIEECLALQRQNGAFDPADFVEWARENPDSVMHSEFLWDKDEASYQWNLLQARRLIKVYVKVVGPSVTEIKIQQPISVPSMRRTGDGSYFMPDAIAANEAMRLEVLDEIKGKLIDMRDKYHDLLPELNTVWRAVKRIES